MARDVPSPTRLGPCVGLARSVGVESQQSKYQRSTGRSSGARHGTRRKRKKTREKIETLPSFVLDVGTNMEHGNTTKKATIEPSSQSWIRHSIMTEASSESYQVKFLPFSSTVESPFWVQYCHLKLEEIKLKEDPIPLVATYGVGNSRLQLVESSLDPNDTGVIANDRVACHGSLLGLNTLESFSKRDKNQLLKECFGASFWGEESSSGRSRLNAFQILTFADLKQHKVLYWFGFPALMCQTPIRAQWMATTPHATDAASSLSSSQSSSSSSHVYQALPQQFHSFRHKALAEGFVGLPPFFVATETTMLHLTDRTAVQELLQDKENLDNVIFGFIDPTPFASNPSTSEPPTMGWPLRNLIAYLSIHCGIGGKTASIVSWRAPLRRLEPGGATTTSSGSNSSELLTPEACASTLERLLLLKIAIPSADQYVYSTPTNTTSLPQPSNSKVVGWELNSRQKPGPRWVNLKPLLDSNHLAIQAADLNLKLMKWRMIPSLQVDMLQDTKVLLLGAGTLGCSVARTLLGWGIRKFTLLDYGTVSYSNPVRQNLFTLEDCHFNNGAGKPKAEAAAGALKTIAADVEATGVHLSIPMPGHTESAEVIADSVTKLDQLIQDCDVVYLLTDTRESRWLPTLMAAAHNKIMINAALGLDSWLVMRHGGAVAANDADGGTRLGCYFCNDVVAPENSTKNRTLDQQCTVTRPGLAPIAASMAVELMVALLHHPLKHRAHAPSSQSRASGSYNPTNSEDSASSAGALGVMPHQIRGSLVSYQMMTPTVPAFGCCTGCSPLLIEKYHENKLEMVHQVCQSTDGSYLEDVTGLTAFRADAAEKLAAMDADDEDLWDE